MFFVTIIIVFAILLVYADDKKLLKNGFWLSFLLIVAVFSIRYGYANDYFNYERTFQAVAKYSSLSLALTNLPEIEVGWLILSFISKPFGFQFSIFVSTLVLCYIYYSLINNYVPKPYRWFGILIFLMHPSLFILDLAMIRQGLAGALIFLSFCKGYENKTIQSILFFLVAPTLHLSALVCLPFVIMINLNKYINPSYIYIGVFSVFLFFLFTPGVTNQIVLALSSNDVVSGEYSSYFTTGQVDSSTSSWKTLFSRVIVILPSVVLFFKLKTFDKYLTIMCSLTPFVIFLSSQNFMFLRMEYYLLPFYTLLFPRIATKNGLPFSKPINKKGVRLLCLGACLFLLVFIVHSYYNFFDQPSYSKAYATYHTIFSTLL